MLLRPVLSYCYTLESDEDAQLQTATCTVGNHSKQNADIQLDRCVLTLKQVS